MHIDPRSIAASWNVTSPSCKIICHMQIIATSTVAFCSQPSQPTPQHLQSSGFSSSE